jgi:hypothetical protein
MVPNHTGQWGGSVVALRVPPCAGKYPLNDHVAPKTRFVGVEWGWWAVAVHVSGTKHPPTTIGGVEVLGAIGCLPYATLHFFLLAPNSFCGAYARTWV